MPVLNTFVFRPVEFWGGFFCLWFLLIVENGFVEGLVAEDTAMEFVFWQAAEVVADFFGGDVVGVF